MNAVARRLAGLAGWRRHGGAALLGAIAALALAPLHLLPVLFLSFTGLVWLLDGAARRGTGFLTVFAFAYGYFVAGLYWTGFSFFVEPERFAALVPLPVLGLPIVLALFPALGWLVFSWLRPHGPARVLVLALGWTLGEYGRAHALSGFPWNLIGYAWTVSDSVIQAAAVLGVHGLGLLTVALAAMPAALADSEGGRAGRPWFAGFALLFAAIAAAGALRLSQAEVSHVAGVRLRLVQANIAQSLKWRDDQRGSNVERQLNLSAAPGAASVTHWIWPETAVPYYLEAEESLRALLGNLAGDGLVFTGALRRSPPEAPGFQAWNSLLVMNGEGKIVGSYDKSHLVPFGEFLPFRPLLRRIGLDKIVPGSIDFSAGVGPGILALPGLPAARVLICYEGIFPEEIWPAGAARPGWLLNVTNDGWFGHSSGPYQHFAMTRVRAVEQGVALVRAANTGISAIVDPYGRIIARLGLGESGIVDGPLPRALTDPPLYARHGDLWALLVVLVFLVLGLVSRRPSPQRP